MAIGGLHLGRGGSRGVEALGATLSVGSRWLQGQQKKGQIRKLAAFHWQNSNRQNSAIQRAPMACQYQTVASTITWRVAN